MQGSRNTNGAFWEMSEKEQLAVLEMAIEEGWAEVVEVIVTRDARFTANPYFSLRRRGTRPDGIPTPATALMLAAARGHRGVCAVLIAAGAAISERDDQGWSALMQVPCPLAATSSTEAA